MAMSKRSDTQSKIRTARYQGSAKKEGGQRMSPVRSPGLPSPRTSPGLLAGHYAGCKFSEPPLPSALPLPPQHWMQTHKVLPYHPATKSEQDVTQQLKMLLKVQA